MNKILNFLVDSLFTLVIQPELLSFSITLHQGQIWWELNHFWKKLARVILWVVWSDMHPWESDVEIQFRHSLAESDLHVRETGLPQPAFFPLPIPAHKHLCRKLRVIVPKHHSLQQSRSFSLGLRISRWSHEVVRHFRGYGVHLISSWHFFWEHLKWTGWLCRYFHRRRGDRAADSLWYISQLHARPRWF